jgi:chromosome segregation ATPase
MEVSVEENPIRRIVNLLQGMQKKIEKEGEEMEDMFEKFQCYCKLNSEKLQTNVDGLNDEIPQHEASVKSKSESKMQIEEELKGHKTDRADANGAVETATEQRAKDKKAFDAYSAEAKSNIASVKKAVAALRKGMGDAFLQTSVAATLRDVVMNTNHLSSFDQDEVQSFLQGKTTGSSGEIVGILEQMGEDMAQDLKEAEESEASSLADFNGLVAAKQKEIAAATTAIEDKTARVGKLAVDIVNSKNDLADAQDALAEDSNFLIELKKTCAEQAKLFDIVKKTRAEEMTAIGATVKILNDDDALDLFKKTLPSPGESLLQVSAKSSARAQAQYLLEQAQTSAVAAGSEGVNLRLAQLALKGKKAGFEKIVKMMDDMVALLGKEQKDDEAEKEYCEAEFEKSEDEEGALNRKIKGLATEIGEGKEAIAALKDGIASLTAGIADLDKSVAEATETRKEESKEYTATKSGNSAAVQLLEVAKNQLNKFYNPTLYKAPPPQEMTEEERIYAASGGTVTTPAPGGIAGTGISFADLSFVQTRMQQDGAPPPPPMAIEAYKKQDSGGPVALIDRLKNDLKMEMQEDDMEEEQAQKDYEEVMAQSAKKRAQDSKSIVEKEQQLAEAEELLQKAEASHKAENAELMALKEYVSSLHSQCDFLLQNFDKRKEARTNEIEAIKKAKAVLAGASFSLAQASFVQFGQASAPRTLGFLEKQEAQCTPADDEQHRVALLQAITKLYKQTNDACEAMCKKMGQYPNCSCPNFEPPDATPGVVTWDELYAIFDGLKESGRTMLKKYSAMH